jgi:hypothetical protein
MTRPDFSPAMLASFIHARLFLLTERCDEKWAVLDMEKAADVTPQEFKLARDGRLKLAAPRLRLWGSFGHVPAEYGIVLTDDGGAEKGDVRRVMDEVKGAEGEPSSFTHHPSSMAGGRAA